MNQKIYYPFQTYQLSLRKENTVLSEEDLMLTNCALAFIAREIGQEGLCKRILEEASGLSNGFENLFEECDSLESFIATLVLRMDAQCKRMHQLEKELAEAREALARIHLGSRALQVNPVPQKQRSTEVRTGHRSRSYSF